MLTVLPSREGVFAQGTQWLGRDAFEKKLKYTLYTILKYLRMKHNQDR